jgi:hypothetical protein
MATKTVQVWIVDHTGENPPRLDTTPRYVLEGPLDEMKKQAVEHVLRAEYTVKTINHAADGGLIAYVYAKDAVRKTATKVPGWAFKRPKIPAIIP